MMCITGYRTAFVVVLIVGSLGWWVELGSAQDSPLAEAEFLVVGNNASPFINFYERTDDTTLAKLDNPSDLPPDNVNSVDWHPDSSFVAAGHKGGDNLTIYSRSGSNFSKVAGVDGVEGTSFGVAFSPDGDNLYVVHESSPFFTVYERSDDTYEKLSSPSVVPSSAARAVAASPDGVYVVVAEFSPSNMLIYKWVDGDLENFAWPSSQPGRTRGLEWSNDGVYLAAGAVDAPDEVIWKQSGDDFTEIHSRDGGEEDARGVSWAPDARTVAWAYDDAALGIKVRKVVNDSASEVEPQQPDTGAVGRVDDVDFSDGARGYLASAEDSSTVVRWHDNSGRSITELTSPEGISTSTGFAVAWSPGTTGRPTKAPGEDDFDEQKAGLLPLSNWYTMGVFDDVCDGGFPETGSYSVEAGGSGSSTLMYQHSKPANQQALSCWFFGGSLDICEVGEVMFDFRWSGEVAGDFPNNEGDGRLGWLFGAGGGAGDEPAIGVRVGGGGTVVLAVGPEGLAPGRPGKTLSTIFDGSPDTWYTAILSIDCAGGTVGLEVVDGGEATVQVTGFEGVALNTFRITAPELFDDAHDQFLDNLGVSLVAEVTEPTEFTEGVGGFMSGLGFQTPESEFFFSIILIGLSFVIVALLTNLMGQSRIRAYLAGIVSMGMGAFCVAVLGLEFWMFVVGVVLGGAVLGGAGPMANLFVGDVRPKKAQAAAAGVGSAGGGASDGEDESGEGGGQEESTMEAMQRLDESGELQEMREEAGITEGASAPEPAPAPRESSGGDGT